MSARTTMYEKRGSLDSNGSVKRIISSDNEENEVKTRIRRTQSVTQAEQIRALERKIRRYQPDRPCHDTRDSIFSFSSSFNKFEGFVNWGALMLVIGGIRLFLENVLKYGIRISPTDIVAWMVEQNKNNSYIHTPIFLLVSQIHFVIVVVLEKRMSQNRLPCRTGMIIHIVHLIMILLMPALILTFWSSAFSMVGKTLICTTNTIIFLKLWSYIQVNHWCRIDQERMTKITRKRCHSFKNVPRAEATDEDNYFAARSQSAAYYHVQYPDNLSMGDLYYFLAAPTLCYELNFPRSHTIRVKFLLRRVLEVFILSNILLGLFQQWIIPSVKNSFKPFSEMNHLKCLERILKLSIPNHLLWLTAFYMVFHSILNTVGELLRFGDRDFYRDWWNAKNVGTFWKLWNLPVHKWCVRHLFVPLVKAKYSRNTAALAVFALSAFLHEYWVSVPLEMYKIGVFLGMLIQFPLILGSDRLERKLGFRAGNIVVWASLILGQPVAIMIYYHDFIIQNYPSFQPSNQTVIY